MKKIGMISDLHIDINEDYDIYGILKDVLLESMIDVLLIAGDICENCSRTLKFVENLNRETKTNVYFVPGNHDMWDTGGKYEKGDTNEVYKLYKESPFCLIDKKIEIADGIYVIGDLGWYDYSFGSEKFSFEEFEKMTLKERTWNDNFNARWGKSNTTLNNEMLEKLGKSLEELEGKEVIMVTHMLTNRYFTVQRAGEWEYFNAFLGSEKYTELCDKYKVKYSLMGHVHYRKIFLEKNTEYVCSCLNYYSEWKSDDAKAEVEKALFVLEI